MLGPMNSRPSLVTRWEDLHVGVQVAIAYTLSTLVLWLAHVMLLNQPVGRGFVYAIFWAVPATVVIVGATRTERSRRLRAEAEAENPKRRMR
jgi:uncharacterized membrane-anchored protein